MKNNRLYGYFITFTAYLIWGILPIYWKLLASVPATEILFHRILWTSAFLLIITLTKYRKYLIHEFRNNPKIKLILLSAMFLGMNWYLFIYAISINRILDASLGYYINPLVSVLLGVIFLGEKLPGIQKISLVFAIIGVSIITVNYGRLPLISLLMAFAFGSYGLVRKKLNMESIPAVFMEATILLSIILIYLFFSINDISEIVFFNCDVITVALLIFSGVVTFFPLVLYGKGVTMISLKSVGFLQYIAPTFMLIIGTLVYGEPFSASSLISFGFIWLGLGLYSWSVLKR